MLRMARQRDLGGVIGQPGYRSTVDVKMDVKRDFDGFSMLKSEGREIQEMAVSQGFLLVSAEGLEPSTHD
jgi:hypothetical protein